MNDTLKAIIGIIDSAVDDGSLSPDDIHEIRDHLADHYKEFRRQDAATVAATLRKGAKVRISFNSGLRPRYLLGVRATVHQVNKSTATIKLGEVPEGYDGKRRFYTGQVIRCPLEGLELMEDADAGA
jgi:hypothetical protein